jgi:proton-translocating NAD(P)+ transhydrogenase subunit alpha
VPARPTIGPSVTPSCERRATVRIGIPKEIHVGEKRVAATPHSIEQLTKLGYGVLIETGAGSAADFTDDAYRQAGAEVATDTRSVWLRSDVVMKVRAPELHRSLGIHEVEFLREGTILICFVWPAQNPDLMARLKARKTTVVAMDAVPRVTRAQKCDALSSMSSVAGYRAIVEAAHHFGRFFTGQMTAAGTVPPARVMVIGAGVAGLAAIGAAKSLGAVVRAFDVRPEVRQQIESLGAEALWIEAKEDGAGAGGYAKEMTADFIKAEMDLFARQAMEVDIIVTTALIPGKPAPKLITSGMVESMRDGSVIVDLAAEQGGNCDLTVAGGVIVHSGVTVIGYTDLPSRMATQSSELYAANLAHLVRELTPNGDGKAVIDMDDEVISGATVMKDGVPTPPPPPRAAAPAPRPAQIAPAAPVDAKHAERPPRPVASLVSLAIAAIALGWVGTQAPSGFMEHLTVFVLACFLGYHVIWNVTPALHTPLMSVTNAISGIIVVGALLLAGSTSRIVDVLAAVSVLIASINVAGGFWVTQRMLKMFRRD